MLELVIVVGFVFWEIRCTSTKLFGFQFPFEPNPNWSSPYPLRDELLEYCLAVAEKYGLYPYAQFNTEVRSMTWDDKAKEWTLALRRYASEHSAEYTEDSMKANIVIDVHKPINEPGFPYFPGAGWSADNPYYLRNKEVQPVSPFEGKVMHSMVYDLDYDITGKRVAVIGCSAAAIQIVPTIAPKCGHLYVYHRFVLNSTLCFIACFNVPSF